jgi:hypothetical protein
LAGVFGTAQGSQGRFCRSVSRAGGPTRQGQTCPRAKTGLHRPHVNGTARQPIRSDFHRRIPMPRSED